MINPSDINLSTDVHACPKSKLHYRLTNEEWVQAVRTLTESQKDVLFYLRTLDPFGDRELDIGVRELGRILDYSHSAISRALTALKAKGYIDLEMIRVRVKIKDSCKDKESLHQSTSGAPTHHSHRKSTDRTTKTPLEIATHHSQPEALAQSDIQNPHTIQTDQTDQTLSHSDDLEREILEVDEDQLLEFATNKVKQSSEIKRPRAYAKKCVKDDRDFWIAEFVKWRQLQEQINVPTQAVTSNDFVIETIDQQRERLIRMWFFAPCRPGIRQAIESHPDLRLKVVNGELREVLGG